MPFGCLRELAEQDTARPYLKIGDSEYDKWSWADHWYDMNAQRPWRVFVYEATGKIWAVLKFRINNEQLFIDLIATDKRKQGGGIGGHLLRWAETHARCSRCTSVSMWAIENKVEYYKKFKYNHVKGSLPITLGATKYVMMERKLLYSLPLFTENWSALD